MLVENWMNRNVVTIDVNESMLEASKVIREHNIRMLPVLDKGKLVGVVTDRDLKRASPSDATSLEVHELLYLTANIKMEEIMTKNPITVPFDYTVEEAAEILLRNKISGVPVVGRDGNIVGTITQTDMFRVLISLTGIGSRGIQFGFLLEDQAGSIKEVADICGMYRTTSAWSESSGSSSSKGPLPASEIQRSPIKRSVPSENCSSLCQAPCGRQCSYLPRR
jgi:acetoin utilization protein AcuB